MDVWAFAKDFGKGAWSLATAWRRWGQEDRAEIEHTYKNELACLQEQLNEADSQEEKARIKQEIKAVRDEQRLFYRARRDLLMSKALVERMTPKGMIVMGGPQLPAPERETLRIAMTLLEQSEPATSFADRFLRGNAFYASERFHDAFQAYNAALALQSDDPDALNNRGTTLLRLKRHEDALADFNRALELRPDHPVTLSNRGGALDRLKRYEEALADYNRSLELHPDDPDALNNRGVTLGHLKRYEEALAHHNRSLQLRPDHPDVLNNRGVALLRLDRHQEALADFNRAVGLRANHPSAMYNIACLYSLCERYEESLQWLERAIARDASCRAEAAEDDDFEALRKDPQWGPKFWELVGTED